MSSPQLAAVQKSWQNDFYFGELITLISWVALVFLAFIQRRRVKTDAPFALGTPTHK